MSVNQTTAKSRLPASHAIGLVLLFGLAGLLAGAVWLSAADDWGPPWFWTLGLLFASAVIPVTIFASSRLLPLEIGSSDAIFAAIILSAAWPGAVLAFVAALAMTASLQPSTPVIASILLTLPGVLVASSCVWLALRVLTGIWNMAIFYYLACSGAIVVALNAVVHSVLETHPFHWLPPDESPRLSIALLVIPGTVLYGSLFCLGLLRARNVKLGMASSRTKSPDAWPCL